jgi:hypothetical protein
VLPLRLSGSDEDSSEVIVICDRAGDGFVLDFVLDSLALVPLDIDILRTGLLLGAGPASRSISSPKASGGTVPSRTCDRGGTGEASAGGNGSCLVRPPAAGLGTDTIPVGADMLRRI